MANPKRTTKMEQIKRTTTPSELYWVSTPTLCGSMRSKPRTSNARTATITLSGTVPSGTASVPPLPISRPAFAAELAMERHSQCPSWNRDWLKCWILALLSWSRPKHIMNCTRNTILLTYVSWTSSSQSGKLTFPLTVFLPTSWQLNSEHNEDLVNNIVLLPSGSLTWLVRRAELRNCNPRSGSIVCEIVKQYWSLRAQDMMGELPGNLRTDLCAHTMNNHN